MEIILLIVMGGVWYHQIVKKFLVLFLIMTAFLPSVSFGRTRGLTISLISLLLGQAEEKQTPKYKYYRERLDELLKQREKKGNDLRLREARKKTDSDEFQRLYNFAKRTDTLKYLPKNWQSGTPKQQMIVLRTHKEWLDNLTKQGFLNPEEYFEYLRKTNPGGPVEFGEGELILEEYGGQRKENYSVNQAYRRELTRAIESSPYKGTIIRFDLQVDTGMIEMVVVKLVYRGKEYGRAKENPGPDNPDNLKLGNFGKVWAEKENRPKPLPDGVRYGNEDYISIKLVLELLKFMVEWAGGGKK